MSSSGALRAAHSAWAAACVGAFAVSFAPTVSAETSSPSTTIDRAVVRFYAPELGGTLQPRFIGERLLAFEARLEAMAETSEGIGDGYDEQRIRVALDRHVSAEVAATLAHKLIAALPPSRRPGQDELSAVRSQLSTALFERLGGEDRVRSAARAEQLDSAELDDLMARRALAAWYIDRAVTPILQTNDEQLREVFRTAAHPYRGKTFEAVRAALERWFIVERVSVAESAFLQGIRVKIVLLD
jgi:hypothetical protein